MPGLPSKQVEAFWSEGFVAPLPALGPAEARGLRDWVETFERDHPLSATDLLQERLVLLRRGT